MNSNDYIPMPTQSEKRAAINSIIERSMPARRTNASRLIRIFKSLGIRGLFFDAFDAVALSLLCSAVLLVVIVADAFNTTGSYIVTFAAAPALYLLLFCISRWKNRSSWIEQIRFTCMITPLHICIAQSMVFSLCGMAFGSLLAFGTTLFYQNGHFINLLCAALCAQFICSTVTMLALDRRCRLLPDIAAGGCAAVCVLLLMLRHTSVCSFIDNLLQSFSSAVMAATTAIFFAVYALTLWNAFSRSNNILKGEMI